MNNPHVEVGTWWREIHDGDVRQVTDVHAHGVHLACNECGVGELYRWSQFTPCWELAPGPKEEPDVEKLLKLEQLLRKRIKLYKDSPLDHPNDLQMNWRVQEEIYATLCGFLKEAGLE